MRCSANGASLRHKATFFALKTVPQAEPTPHQSAGADSFPSEGKPKRNHAARGAKQTAFAPNTETFSAVHNISVAAATGRTRSPGVSGGGAALSPGFQLNLCLPEQIGAHFAAQSPECAFLRRFRVSGFCLRSFAQAKNGVNLRRRSHKISVTKAKTA